MDETELRAFLKRLKKGLRSENNISIIAEPKLDGLGVELVYENGIFVYGSTRGDGINGENITQNLKTIPSIPLSLRTKEQDAIPLLEVRGEVFISKSNFKKLNSSRLEEGLDQKRVDRIVSTMSLKKLAKPEDVANSAIMLASDSLSGHITGQVIEIAGGMEGRIVAGTK